ncbi:hypothetical protein DPMN_179744 [Dreissena polymorpha]|uniref:Uncharacterized protein n=1 Tax=Dreissena polymorpha TaxID=45954 RepID=A0A9D4EFM9_DREPO|nr:hypothetical protein DPMN_179744 [Dreissena polymorpha]
MEGRTDRLIDEQTEGRTVKQLYVTLRGHKKVMANVNSNETNVSTKFHDDWAKIVTSRVFTRDQARLQLLGEGEVRQGFTGPKKVVAVNSAPPPGGNVFQQTGTIFELDQHIISTNILTKLHEDLTSNVTSTVFTSFELSRGINGTNVLTKFHENRTINVASRVFTRQNVDDGQRTKGDHKSSP